MATEIGDLTSSGTIQQTRRTYRSNGTKTVEYVLNTADEATFLGSFSIGTTVDDGLYLESIAMSKFKGVGRATLNFVTKEQLVTGSYGGTGTSKASDSNASEQPLEQNQIWIAAGRPDLPGVTGYLAPQPTYTYTQIVNSFTFSEANIIAGVGSLSSPTGMSSPTAGKWLKTSKTVTPQGDKYEITETWQYSNTAWGTALYS